MLQRSVSFLLLIFFLVLPGCAKTPEGAATRKNNPGTNASAEATHMPRADPAYLQYMERQSMLLQSSEMAKIVSGSELAWRSSAGAGGPAGMLDYADNWLFIHPMTVLTTSRMTVFGQLASSATWPMLRELGVRGLYVAPIQGSGALWAKERTGFDTGDDVVQYDFSRAVGNEDQYRRLMNSLIDQNVLLGSDLIPGATGLGPDFFLAVRNVREYPGIYCMVEIPQQFWKHLPDMTGEWGGAALGQAQIEALSREGLLPKAMRDDMSPLGRPGGWAATGGIRGIDGNIYRWVYRFHNTPDFAVLNWEDPSRAAHRILSGSAVRQVGLQGQALLGMRFEALQGLEAAHEDAVGSSFSVEPARTAAQSMGREVHRYGGWSWTRDDSLPLHSLSSYLSSGVDYIYDSAFSPGAEHALLSGDASLLRFMADEALRLRVPFHRLIHVMPNQDGINYSLPHLSYLAAGAGGGEAASFRQAIQNVMRSLAAKANPPLVQNNHLYATAPGLAALALDATSFSEAQAKIEEIEKGHSLLVFFKAMQPGVVMLTGQDLSGVLPLQWGGGTVQPAASSRGGYGLTFGTAGLPVTTQGMPRAPQLYPAPDMQVQLRDSFMQRIGSILRPRTQAGIAKGSLIARPDTRGKGSIALLTRLPDGKGFLLSVCNFSRERVTENISLSGVSGLGSALSRVSPIALGGSHKVTGPQTVSVTLGPWEGRALLLGGASGGPVASDEEQVTPIPTAPEVPPMPQAKPQPERGSTVPKIVLDDPPPSDPDIAPLPMTDEEERDEEADAVPEPDAMPEPEKVLEAPKKVTPSKTGAAPLD
jgi:trehalose synthase